MKKEIAAAMKMAAEKVAKRNGWMKRDATEAVETLVLGFAQKHAAPILTSAAMRACIAGKCPSGVGRRK